MPKFPHIYFLKHVENNGTCRKPMFHIKNEQKIKLKFVKHMLKTYADFTVLFYILQGEFH